MKTNLLIILVLISFMFSCASNDSTSANEDATGDTIRDIAVVVEDDSTGDTVTIEIPIIQDDPIDISDTDDGQATDGESTAGSDVDSSGDTDNSDVTVSNDDPVTDPDVPEVVVVEIPKNELLTHVDTAGIKALALKPREFQSNNYASKSDRMMSIIGGDDCHELGSLDGDTYNEIVTEGSVPCFSNVEMVDGFVYANYYLYDATESPALMYLSETPIDFSIIIDASGDVHHLPGQPKKRNSFKNVKMIKSHNGKPTYINKDSKLVWFDLSTDTEIVMIGEAITNFSIKNKSDGDHYIIDSTTGVKRIKPDQSEEMLTELTPGNYHDIGGSIQYISGGKFKRMIFDDDGNITDRVGRSDPETFQAWIIAGAGGGAMPNGVLFGGSISGCTDEAIGSQRIMICNGKAFRVSSVENDLKQINWCDYGHCGLNSWLTIKNCSSQDYLFFYGEDTLGRKRLTWINDLTSEFRDILDTHQITDLECISDSELAVIGTRYDEDLELYLTETLSITGADTISPVATVINFQITDVITP